MTACNTSVVIIGAGPAGTVAALAAQQAGLDVVVYEAYAHMPNDEGAFLTIGAHGMTALAQVGVDTAVAEAGFPLTRLEAQAADGTTRACRDLPGYYHLRRADLVATLREQAHERGIEIKYGRRLQRVTQSKGPGCTAHFEHGHRATGMVVIGADGLRSEVRRHISPKSEPEYAGQWVVYGVTANNPTNAEVGVLHGIPSRRISFGYTVSPEQSAFWFARIAAPQLGHDILRATSAEQWRQHVVTLLRDEAPGCVPVVEGCGTALHGDNIYEVALASRWHRGSVAVLGDAAHAVSPANAQGASLAFEDAVVLGKALRDRVDGVTAFAAYERLRRPRIERLTAAAGRRDDDRSWISDYPPVRWDIPVTDELVHNTEIAQRPE